MKKSIVVFAFLMGAAELLAQESVRLDVGYGGAPNVEGISNSYRGYHVTTMVGFTFGELGISVVQRSRSRDDIFFGPQRENLIESTTAAALIAHSWKTPRASLTISLGVGMFIGTQEKVTFNELFQIQVSESRESFLAFPADVRMCWEFDEHLGVGAAVFATYIPGRSYLGFHLFGRARFW